MVDLLELLNTLDVEAKDIHYVEIHGDCSGELYNANEEQLAGFSSIVEMKEAIINEIQRANPAKEILLKDFMGKLKTEPVRILKEIGWHLYASETYLSDRLKLEIMVGRNEFRVMHGDAIIYQGDSLAIACVAFNDPIKYLS